MATTINLQPQATEDLQFQSIQNTALEVARNVVSAEEPTPLSRKIVLKLLSLRFSFFVAGTIDGSMGPLIPYMLLSYDIGTSFISIICAASFVGWLLAAAMNSHMLQYLDTGAILAIGAALQLTSNLLRFWSPPFGLFATTFFISSLGVAFQDSHSNTFVSTVNDAHRWLGFIHAMYALGALVSPFVATPIAASMQPKRSIFYVFLVGLRVVNMVGVLVAFRDSIRSLSRSLSTSEDGHAPGRGVEAFRGMANTLRLRVVWILSIYFFFMLGIGITAGGWVVEYLVDVRHGKLSKVGYTPAGLYGGIFLGRLLLAEPTHRFGERRMILLYSVVMLALQVIFWLVPNIIASATALSLLGFFFGPLFPIGVSVGTKLFPNSVKASALGLVFVVAQAGGSLFPSITGFIASSAGVKVLQPILVGFIVAMGVSWDLVPKVPHRSD
ncbi:MFS general substrate transporter [Hyaloscypha variabilis F]|uniref:MFS general substrate transporter n=1 Tax=Hyaloscypha variabilis (strain UAMH 11265 / GT02V1 / F) TaxID=1149755 RepID=A0A2J6S9I7_HYAVF|nr:MFS general substrate transporter [Hyaloscypha variabilis F]